MTLDIAIPVEGKTPNWVVDLASVRPEGRAALGGKAAALATLMAEGLPVPPAFCVTVDAFRLFVRHGKLLHELGRLSDDDAESYATIRSLVLSTPLPDALSEAIRSAYARLGRPSVAVRSSARAEDSAERSFAGQHDTLLNVQGEEALLEAIRTCWASLWTERARSYRQLSRDSAPREIAVVVQVLVRAEKAGVLFTTDPVSRRADRLVVESCWGLGEGLVGSSVPGDTFFVDARGCTVAERHVRYKGSRVVAQVGGGVGVEPVPPSAREQPSLDDRELQALARWGLSLRDRRGAEQDIEWAFESGKLWLLQARPITTAAAPPRYVSPYDAPQPDSVQSGTLWSRMDIGEIFTGRMTPLGISFAKYYQYNVHLDCGRAVGLLDKGRADLTMGYLQGFVYLNVSYSAYLLAQSPPTRNPSVFTSRFTSEEVDLTHYENPFGHYPGGLMFARTGAFWAKSFATELASMRQRASYLTAKRFAELDRHLLLDLRSFTVAELGRELERCLRFFHEAHVGYMPYYINAFGFYGILTKLCSKWLGGEGAELQNRLKADMSNLRTVDSARELWRLTEQARQRPRVLSLIRDTALADVLGALERSDEGAQFVTSCLKPFLRMNGVRAREEMELTHPRWIDDPSYVFQMIRKYVEEDFSVEQFVERGRSERADVTSEMMRRLPWTQRQVVGAVASQYAICSELRETVRMAMITSIWLVRRLVYELAERALDQGLLRSLEEVAYLDFQQLRSYAAGQLSAGEAFSRSEIEAARQRHRYYRRLPEPPLTFIGQYDPAQALVELPLAQQLNGLGSSPGRAIGRARVIHDLVQQAAEFRPGEILVTAFTDASWTPLFAVAGGVVTDIGSMLSHSSIVAREFNIPSVVNARSATRVIRTGDKVVVDGDAGTVRVIDERTELS